MSSRISNTKLIEFYARYGHIIAEEIRAMCKLKQVLLREGSTPYSVEYPDLDPELTVTLQCLQDTFDPSVIVEEPLVEVQIIPSVFKPLYARLKNICFLTKTWAMPIGTRCFQCLKTIDSEFQYIFWVKCVECPAIWCSMCYATNEALEDNHKPLMHKTACSGILSAPGVTPVLKCGTKFNGAHRRWKKNWMKCPRCLEWRCETCLTARQGPCNCTGVQREMPKFYNHFCFSGKKRSFIS